MTEPLVSADEQKTSFVSYVELPGKRARVYYGLAAALILWFVGYVFLLAKIYPTAIYWLSYYVVNYHVGFVRRGLAGQLIAFFPDEYYFPVAYTLVWGSFALYCGALAVLAWHVLFRGARSERRLLVSLLIPVLPFAVVFALFGPRPELYALSALILFGIFLTRSTGRRAVVVSSALLGVAIATLAFVHELIPLQLGLGAVLAISVLAPQLSTAVRWLCMTLSVGPGLLATVIIVFFGRRDVGTQICEQVPHRLVPNPFVVPQDKTADYVLGRYESVTDYHDWVCQNIVPYFDADVAAWMQTVVNIGIPGLLAGFAHGLLVCVGTLWLIQYFTRVSWKTFVRGINGGLAVPLLALAMMIPIFATGVDWIRWWTIILANVAVVYLIFAAGQSEIDKSVSNRQWKVAVVVIVVLACIPLSAGPGYFSGWVTI